MSSLPPSDHAPADKRIHTYPRAFFVAMVACALFFLSLVSLFPILPRYALSLGLNEADWGLSTAIVGVVAAVLRIVGGPLADRVGRKPVLIVGGLAAAAGSLILIGASGWWGFLTGRVVQGIAVGLFSTAYKALVIDMSPEARRGEAIGLGNLTFSAALFVAPPIAEWIQSRYGFSATLLFTAIAGLAATLVLWPVRATGHTPAHRSMLSCARVVIPLPSTLVGIVGMLSAAFAFVATFTFLPFLAEQRNIAGVGVAFSVFALADISGQPFGGRLGDRFGRRFVIGPGLVLAALGVFLFLQARGAPVLYTGAALIGVGTAVARVNIDMLVMEGAPLDLRGTAGGWQYFSWDIWIGAISGLLGYLVRNAGYEAVYALLAVATLMMGLVMWLITPFATRRTVAYVSSALSSDS